jgi:hypothetical protein
MKNKILESIRKFELSLNGKVVLTEAATGNYVVTSVIAALAGATVIAFTKDSKYGSADQSRKQTLELAEKMKVHDRIKIIEDLDEINLKEVDILTNTGFLRPINAELLTRLSSSAVIPLMWETWEYRASEFDLDTSHNLGIKVYGTDEDDERLKTKEYIGYIVLSLLLDNKLSPFSSKVLLLGGDHFVNPVESVLRQNNYEITKIKDYSEPVEVNDFQSIVVLEHENDLLIIGDDNAYINKADIEEETLVIHICGNVSFEKVAFKFIPDRPSSFGYMSYTTDFIDSKAVIDLHCAGLKVAEGMLKANEKRLDGADYREYMEKNYPAQAFENPKYW